MLAPVELKLMTKEEASKKADELLARVGFLTKPMHIRICFRAGRNSVLPLHVLLP